MMTGRVIPATQREQQGQFRQRKQRQGKELRTDRVLKRCQP